MVFSGISVHRNETFKFSLWMAKATNNIGSEQLAKIPGWLSRGKGEERNMRDRIGSLNNKIFSRSSTEKSFTITVSWALWFSLWDGKRSLQVESILQIRIASHHAGHISSTWKFQMTDSSPTETVNGKWGYIWKSLGPARIHCSEVHITNWAQKLTQYTVYTNYTESSSCILTKKIAARHISSTFQVSRNPGMENMWKIKDINRRGPWLLYSCRQEDRAFPR